MSRIPSASQHNFAMAPQAEIQRSKFNRSCGYKTTFDSGYLIPVFVDEALPGDTFNLRMTAFARLATPIFPIMDNLYLDSHFFAVPLRLLWSNFQKFMGEQINPGDSTSYLVPQMVAPASVGYAIGSISDYFGLPTGVPGYSHSALWHRAYNLIWNEWFRDENLQTSLTVPLGDGPDTPATYTLQRRGKRHDYFTSALPWPQKGPAVTLPLSGNAPIIGLNASGSAGNSSLVGYNTRGDTVPIGTPNAGSTLLYATTQTTGAINGTTNKMQVFADLSATAAATINQLRQAFQIQRLYERDARGGTRYIEILRSHFGVTSPDARLQRPEYLGGSSTPVNITPIAQTSAVPSQPSPLGNLSAIGTVHVKDHHHGFTKSFVEHSIIIGFVSVRADLGYQQGMNRMFSRSTRFDFYWPALAHIGEQAVLNKEIYTQGTANPTQDEAVFGYQERFAEYRYKPSQVTGLFRSTAAVPLDAWHLAQKFTALPALNSTFIQDTPPVKRVIAVPSQPDFLFDAYYELNCARPMPTYSVPGLIDHF